MDDSDRLLDMDVRRSGFPVPSHTPTTLLIAVFITSPPTTTVCTHRSLSYPHPFPLLLTTIFVGHSRSHRHRHYSTVPILTTKYNIVLHTKMRFCFCRRVFLKAKIDVSTDADGCRNKFRNFTFYCKVSAKRCQSTRNYGIPTIGSVKPLWLLIRTTTISEG